MAKVIGTGTTVIRKDSKVEAPGGWLSSASTRKRKGLIPTSTTTYGVDVAINEVRPNSVLSDSELWSVYRRTPDVRAAIDSIVRRVATFDWTIEPTVDATSELYPEASELARKSQRFMSAPNKDGETWQELMTSVLTDLLVFDAGSIEVVFDSKKRLKELIALPGTTIRPVLNSHGRVLKYVQDVYNEGMTNTYLQAPAGSHAPEFKPDELVYLQMFTNTHSGGYGNPLIESIVNEVITLLRGSEHIMLAYDADEIPPGILVLAGLAGNAAREARADLQNMRGQDHKIRVLTTPDPAGAGAKWVELRHTPKDLEFQDIMQQIRRTVWRVFGVMPVEMGSSDAIPRATAQVQLDVSASHLVTPILELLQAKINARILPLVVGDSELSKLVTFKFDRTARPNAEEAQYMAQRYQRLIGIGVMTRNEVRKEMGYLPITSGDVPTVDTAQGPVPLDLLVKEGPVGALTIEEPSVEDEIGTSVDSKQIEDIEDTAPGEVDLSDFDDTSFYRIKFSDLPEKIQKTLKSKSKDHNEEVGDDKRKRTTPGVLGDVYDRGVGAYHTNPGSVRPTVKSPEQWGLGRVNSFLYALRNLKFKSGKHDTDLLPKSHPMSTDGKEEKAVGDKDPTNFPKKGDDKKVSLRNSSYKVFDLAYAEDLKENFPEIWDKGGNIEGNNQYRRLVPIVKRNGVVDTETEEMAVRKREAWSARHFKDYRIPGVIAQIKWLAVGSRGESYMKDLINKEKEKYLSHHSHDCESHGCSHDDQSYRNYFGYLPSEWQPDGFFSDYRTIRLDELGFTVAQYTKFVQPYWREARDRFLSALSSRYKNGYIDEENATYLRNEISKIIESLEVKWNVATYPLYLEASSIAYNSAASYINGVIDLDHEQLTLSFNNDAMFYLTNPEGLLGVMKTKMITFTDALVSNGPLVRTNPKPPKITVPKGVEPGIEIEELLDSARHLWDSQENRIENWSGKLVELSNIVMASSLSSSVSFGQEAGDEWYYEWVEVGDNRTCPTCRAEGATGFRPMSQMTIYPGGGTVCGARCRCVLVFWKKSEIDSGVAEILGPADDE
jgi:hypothetical protein